MGTASSLHGQAPCRNESLTQTHQFLQQYWNSLPPDEVAMSSGMHYGEQSKYVNWDFNDGPEHETLELLQITDVQFGHIGCRIDRIKEYRDWVLSKPNRYMLWTGDMVDAWALWSPGTGFEQIADPQSQVMQFCNLWAPARHRILGFVGGNHERRAIPAFGDLGVLIATMLKIPYSNGRQLVDIHFGDHKPFKVSLWHGRGAARTKGTIAQTLQRFMQQGDSQLYLMGHLHQALILPDWKEFRHPTRNRIELRKVIGAVGSSFMETWGTYGEVAGYSAGDVMMARTVLERNGKWEVTLR